MRKEKHAYLILGFVTYTYRVAVIKANDIDMARIRGQGFDMEGSLFHFLSEGATKILLLLSQA